MLGMGTGSIPGCLTGAPRAEPCCKDPHVLKKLVQTQAFKWVLAAGVLAGAAAGPWGISAAPQWWSALTGGNTGKPSHAPTEAALVQPGPSAPGSPGAGAAPAEADGAAQTNPPSFPLAEVFRFDMSIREVMARWPRVSTGLAELQLQGYRVTLVTGTAETDLAGSLTYYFNPHQQVQRITFQGTTGDGRELVRLLAARYGFQRRLTNDPGLFVYQAPVPDAKGQSVLRMKLAPMLTADRPHQRFDVWLTIERPPQEEQSLARRLLGDG